MTNCHRAPLIVLAALLSATGGVWALQVEVPIEACGIEANRLPPLLVPERYELTLNASALAEHKFTGQVSILAHYTDELPSTPRVTFLGLLRKICQKVLVCGLDRLTRHRKRQILLNVGRTLRIERVLVDRVASGEAGDDASMGGATASSPLQVDEICRDNANQLMAITLTEKPAKGDLLEIRIEYRGHMAKDSRGFYESLNRVAGGQGQGEAASTATNFIESAGANTHFFPADARSTFPCFDQPNLKAVFSLKLVHDKDLVSVSNMAPVSSKVDELTNLKEVQFADTPPMSSYLLAFAVGNFDKITCQAEGKTRPLVTAYAPAGRTNEAQFTLNTVCRAIPLVENYLRRAFPLTKLDLVSSRQMVDPARENWGMLVFTEEFLLTDERDTTLVVREEIAKLATHVVLHQWFGNQVTASWWDDQWIFDGFAIWRSHALASELYPEFSYDFNYLLRLQSPMLDAHASGAVHPIKTHQDLSADEELKLFDANTYNKAAALFQMTNVWLGEFVLRDSLIYFIEAHSNSHANVQNLTRALDSTSGLSLEPYLRSWLNQPGVPLVIVERSGRNELKLKQERLLDGSPITWRSPEDKAALQKGKDPSPPVWNIPLEIVFSDSRNLRDVVRTTFSELGTTIPGPAWFRHYEKGHWFKLNVDFSCLYRVQYPQDVLNYLRAPLEQGTLSPRDRFNIIDDLRALYTMDKVSVDDLLRVLEWYDGERHGGVLSGLALVVDALSARESKARVEEVTLKLFGPVFESQRFKVEGGQSHADMLGRQEALVRLIQHNHEPALEEAVQVFEASDVHLEPFLRRPVYLAILKRGSDAQVEELVERLKATKSELERSILRGFLNQFAPDDVNHPWNILNGENKDQES